MKINKGNNRFLSFAPNKQFVVTLYLVISLILVAASADSAATVIDQYPTTNSDDSHVINVSSPGWGQSFTGTGASVSQAWFNLQRAGNPTGNIVAKIYSLSGSFGSSGIPGTLLATSNPVNVSTIPTVAFNKIYFTFATPYTTTNATHYVVTCEYSGGNSSNLLKIAFDRLSPSHPGNVVYKTSNGFGAVSSEDLCFGVIGGTASSTITTTGSTSGSTVKAYGAPWRWFSLDNMNIGTDTSACHGSAISYRFRADHTGQVSAAMFYFQVMQSGYAKGDGGVITCQLQTDDDTSNHFPSGQVLASFQVAKPQTVSGGKNGLFNRFAFNPQATITAGQLYHLVLGNASSDPKNNWYDANNLCNSVVNSPLQPAVADNDYAVLRKLISTGAWVWDERVKHDTPIFTLYYTDGYSLGQAYMQLYPTKPWLIQGNSQAREIFTVTGGDKTVSQMSAALFKASGSSPGALTLRLEQGNGTLIEQGTIAAASVPSGSYQSVNWVTYILNTPRTLTNGSTYHLVVSAPAGNAYSLMPMMKGSCYNFAGWQFKDGWIEKNTGSGWTSNFPEFGWNGPNFDMMFFFK